MSVVLVDWLGRGGIAQTSESWRRVLEAHEHDVTVVTRTGRELRPDVSVKERRGWGPFARLSTHFAVAQSAAHTIRDSRPDVVVVQNYIVPVLERSVYAAAREVGARVVVVVHDHVPHTSAGGSRLGLRRLVSTADVVVAHTRFVADALRRSHRLAACVEIPHPLALSVLEAPRPPMLEPDERPTAILFGILNRRYKNAALVHQLEEELSGRWRFVAAGVGASSRRGIAIDRFLGGGELASLVEASDVAILPYTFATQSGAVVLAQALGTVPVATAVGGIPDQILDGVDGVLVPADASSSDWCAALERVAEAGYRQTLAEAGRKRTLADHDAFTQGVLGLMSGLRP